MRSFIPFVYVDSHTVAFTITAYVISNVAYGGKTNSVVKCNNASPFKNCNFHPTNAVYRDIVTGSLYKVDATQILPYPLNYFADSAFENTAAPITVVDGARSIFTTSANLGSTISGIQASFVPYLMIAPSSKITLGDFTVAVDGSTVSISPENIKISSQYGGYRK